MRWTGETWWLTATWLFFALMGMSIVADADSEAPLAGWLVGGVLVAFGMVLAVRTLRCEIRIGPDHLLVRTMYRTRQLPWSEVVGASVEAPNPTGLLALVAIELRSGRHVRVDGIANWAIGREIATLPVSRMAAAINERVAAG